MNDANKADYQRVDGETRALLEAGLDLRQECRSYHGGEEKIEGTSYKVKVGLHTMRVAIFVSRERLSRPYFNDSDIRSKVLRRSLEEVADARNPTGPDRAGPPEEGSHLVASDPKA